RRVARPWHNAAPATNSGAVGGPHARKAFLLYRGERTICPARGLRRRCRGTPAARRGADPARRPRNAAAHDVAVAPRSTRGVLGRRGSLPVLRHAAALLRAEPDLSG